MASSRLTKQRISDLLCNAFEGGSNYWYRIDKFNKPPKLTFLSDREFAKTMEREPEVYKHLDYPMNVGGSLVITVPDDDGKEYTLDLAAIRKGCVVFKEKYPTHYADAIKENDDAETGDVFLQCCLFGEVIYG